MFTLTRQQVRELDRRTIEEFGLPSFTLMENAARACADECERVLRLHGVQRAMRKLNAPGSKDDIPRTVAELERWKEGLSDFPEPTYILCGPGNNGGDGLAIARTLHNRGYSVVVCTVGSQNAASPDVRRNHELLRACGLEPLVLADEMAVREFRPRLRQGALLVDALFGTGLTRTLEDPWRAAVQAINESGVPVLAVDIPSGLDADSGDVLGVCVRAEITVTFVAAKPGFLLKAGPSFCGKVQVAEIGVPRKYLEELAG
ncbi:MAG: NAD(P)H-hydrate epimerase [Planctomycetes bacterium]|nr:NAD(P)H-hydrate epimerase [Planctomycetota bacterium]MCW8134926.1 NAD(P)H-hydrate epimerase [Planctomycetota bacterium]